MNTINQDVHLMTLDNGPSQHLLVQLPHTASNLLSVTAHCLSDATFYKMPLRCEMPQPQLRPLSRDDLRGGNPTGLYVGIVQTRFYSIGSITIDPIILEHIIVLSNEF